MAELRAGAYDWMAAADLYKQGLDRLADGDDGERGRVAELLARSYFKAAFQAENREEFKRRMNLAQAAQEWATGFYQKAGLEGERTRSSGRGVFDAYWLADSLEERKGILKTAIDLVEEATKVLENSGDKRRLADAHLDLLNYLLEAHFLIVEYDKKRKHFEKEVEIGKRAIGEFEAVGNIEGLFESLRMTLFFLAVLGSFVVEPARFEELVPEISSAREKLRKVSQKIGTPIARCRREFIDGWAAALVEGDYAKALRSFEAGEKLAEETKDSYVIGELAQGIVTAAMWIGITGEDVDQRRETLEKGVRSGLKAVETLEIPLQYAWLDISYNFLTECYAFLGNYVENEPEKKILQFRKAIAVGRKGTAYSLIPDASHGLSKAMYFLGTMNVDPVEKEQLLNGALRYRTGSARFHDISEPYSWDRGVQHNYLALIKAELSKIEKDPSSKIRLLQEAIGDMEECIAICSKWATTPSLSDALANYEEWYGDILFQLYRLDNETDHLERSINVYEDAITRRVGASLGGPVAPVRWKIAKVQDALGNYERASGEFRKAAKEYTAAAKRLPGLGSFFGELASYMDAWSLIEEARLRHGEEQYSVAGEKYTEAARKLESTKTWPHLSRHYTACSLLEQGEGLGREEKSAAAVERFSAAAKTFHDVRGELESLVSGKTGSDGEELVDWARTSEGRERYCMGRMELEEAKLLDRKGNEEGSCRKFRSGSEIFRGLLKDAPSPQGRSEMETLMLFSMAWAKMKEAEIEASPVPYSEGADLFLKAKEVSRTKRSRLLALANASICRALEAGSRFRLTREPGLYSEIKKSLDVATGYYEEAGLRSPADWTRATARLFDALAYLADAETEKEARRKTELYHLAEKHLEFAARLYGEAGFGTKREEALRHLKWTREEKELLLTPVEALAENPVVSGASIAPVSLVRDQALGLERFEAANVVGNISVPEKVVGVGSEVVLELEMANVGKTAATLIKLENLEGEGLELDRERNPSRGEDGHINMKGKRLEHLKTHEVKVRLKAVRKGEFKLRPRVLFVDEKGNYRSYEFEPAALTVQELGISGWLKGPR